MAVGVHRVSVFLVFALLLAPVQAGLWAIKKKYSDSSCTSMTSQESPLLLNECILGFRGVLEKIYLKSTCSGGNLKPICYSNADCTTEVADQNGGGCPALRLNVGVTPVSCTKKSNHWEDVKCDVNKEVVQTKFHRTAPAFPTCDDQTYIRDYTYPIDLCYIAYGVVEYRKAKCKGRTIEVTRYDSDSTCSGPGTAGYTIKETCTEVGQSQKEMIISGCGVGETTSGAVTMASLTAAWFSVVSMALILRI